MTPAFYCLFPTKRKRFVRTCIILGVNLQQQIFFTMSEDNARYEEWLTTIANTRLVYNTMEELEQFYDNRSIHSNGIRRCFATHQKLRSAYRDIRTEVELQTDGGVNLDYVMRQYRQAWTFFRDNLYRRANPERVAMEILSYCYPPFIRDGIGAGKNVIYNRIVGQDISVPFLVLMLMKVIPGYDSKDGDVIDMPRKYESTMQMMEKFAGSTPLFDMLPAITRAREETPKTRLALLFHVQQILDTYTSFTEPYNLYDVSSDAKDRRANPDIVGYWNECGGKLLYTNFWQIEDALDYGTYFLTHWHKDAENKLTGIRYSMFIMEGAAGNLVCYILHPEAIRHRMKGIAYGDADHVWYHTAMTDGTPTELPLQRLMFSAVWPLKINLTRCTDGDVVSKYDAWLNKGCEIVKPYKHLEYEFRPNLYAVTQTHLYIPAGNTGEYYKVPRASYSGLDRIQLSDNVGTMQMDGKTYLAFDELMLYISTGRSELK